MFNKISKKILTIILLLIIIFMQQSVVKADTSIEEKNKEHTIEPAVKITYLEEQNPYEIDEKMVYESDSKSVTYKTVSDVENSQSIGDTVTGFAGSILNGIVGVFFYVFKLVPMLIGRILMSIIGLAVNGTDTFISGLNLDKILFNEIPILSVNFFETVPDGVWSANTINNIREQVAVWYVAIRNLAAAILAVMVLYVGIRMAISSVAEDKAKYKRMLGDWVVSLVLLFVLHYIMILIININDSIVAVLAKARTDSSQGETALINEAWNRAMNPLNALSFTEQLAYSLIYFMLAIMTFIFFATYIKRMITIAFLIMIAPIITVTYSLDRMGDGKSQALNTWFKNFIYNILLQPFQCIIYIALVQSALNTADANNISSVIIAIIMVFFMYQAEDIIKDIFHFEAKSVASTIAQTALVTSAIGLVTKSASKAGSVKGYANRSGANKNANKTSNPNTNTNPNGNPSTNPSTNPNGNPSTNPNTNPNGNPSTNPNTNPNGNPSTNPNTNLNGNSNKNTSGKTNIGGFVLNGLSNIGKTAVREVEKFPLAVALGAAGLATGNLANAVSGFNAGRSTTESILANRDEKENLHRFAKNYRNLINEEGENIYAGHDDNWIRERTSSLLKGEVQPENPGEAKYYESILEQKDRYISQGYSADDAVTQVEQNVAGIQRNYIGEASLRQRFYGNIPMVKNLGIVKGITGDDSNNKRNNNP